GARLRRDSIRLKEPNGEDGNQKTPPNEIDESLRSRPIVGLQMLAGFEPDGENEWDDGTIYNPEDGKTYSSKMELVDANTLEVKGCVLMFCQTQSWTRVE